MRIKAVILCEGESDQILIGAYLGSVIGLKYQRIIPKDDPFSGKRINWFLNESEEYIAIWSVDGNDFIPAITTIVRLEKYECYIKKVAILTDHDDDSAEIERPRKIYDEIDRLIDIDGYDSSELLLFKNKWFKINYEDSFGQKTEISILYMLIPQNSEGALETYMLNALSEDEHKKEVIIQVIDFIREVKSEKYLRKRREKIKSELGVSIQIFNPERMFDTMMELINSVDWIKFDTTNEQFRELSKL